MLSFSSMPTKLTKKSRRFNRATEVFSFSYYNFSLFYVFLTFFMSKKRIPDSCPVGNSCIVQRHILAPVGLGVIS